MSVYKSAFYRLQRAYPSLNLMIKVSQDQTSAQVVLPGLRFNDIDHTGQPNIATIFDIMSHVEMAAMGHEPSFLDNLTLRKKNIRSYIRACILEIRSGFYETTTPKSPLNVQVKLTDIGNTTYTTTNRLYAGGQRTPCIKLKSIYSLINKVSADKQIVPKFWHDRFTPTLSPKPSQKVFITQVERPSLTHSSTFAVPLSATDYKERTRCASYVRFFVDNSSIASRNEFFQHIKSSFHEFHIKRLHMLYLAPSYWGETLTSETWQGDSPLEIHCLISRGDVQLWYSKMELYEQVFGYPSLQTTNISTG